MVLFEASEEVKEVQVIILQDDVVEGIEVFTARLLTQDGATGVTIGGNGVATTTIEDDDSEHCTSCLSIGLCIEFCLLVLTTLD